MSRPEDAFERAAEKQAMVDAAMGGHGRHRGGRGSTGREGPPVPFGWQGPWAPGHIGAATWLVLWLTLLPVHWLVSREVDGWFVAHLLLISFSATVAFASWQRGKV